jgi:streptogramin lyase
MRRNHISRRPKAFCRPATAKPGTRHRPRIEALEDRSLPSATVHEFAVPQGTHPNFVVGAPDGDLWFDDLGPVSTTIYRLHLDGTVQKYSVPSGNGVYALAIGPDGNTWFSELYQSMIGYVTPDGHVTEINVPSMVQPLALTAGPDGNLWFSAGLANSTSQNLIGRMTPGGSFTFFSLPAGQIDSALLLTTGADGNVWFGTDVFDQNGNITGGHIGRITPQGIMTLFGGLSGGPYQLARGPDGNVWFTEKQANKIGKITTDGIVTEYTVPTPKANPTGIIAGPDGNLWFAENSVKAIDDIAPDGTFGAPIATTSYPKKMTSGPGGFPWFAEIDRVGEVVIPGMPLHGHIIATGADQGGGPEVHVYDAYSHVLLRAFDAYDSRFPGGVRIAVADVNHDGVPDIITAPGPGGGPDVRVFDGATGQVIMEFMAYDPRFPGGVYVAAGDVNNDGFADIITGAGAGGGPEVKVFSGKDGSVLHDFMAYDYRFTGGVRVAAGDVNGDSFADVITGAGPGGGPHVEAWSGQDGSLLESFMAYPAAYSAGVFVAAGDLRGSGRADIIVSEAGIQDPQLPEVQVFHSDGTVATYTPFTTTGLTGSTGQMIAANGIHIGFVSDIDGDGGGEILVSQGSYGTPTASILDPASGQALDSFFAYDSRFLGGVFIGGQ